MLSELSAAYEAAKTGVELLRNALGAKVARDVEAALVGVNEHLLRLQTIALGYQSEVARLSDAVREAAERERAQEKKLAELYAFDAEQAAHRLHQVAPGAFAYRRQDAPAEGAEPNQQSDAWFCAQCFDQRRKSILQYAGYEAGDRLFRCAHCGGQIRVKEEQPSIGIVSVGRRLDFTGFIG